METPNAEQLLENLANTHPSTGKAAIRRAVQKVLDVARALDVSHEWPELEAVRKQFIVSGPISREVEARAFGAISGLQNLIHLEIVEQLIADIEFGNMRNEIYPDAVAEALQRAKEPGWAQGIRQQVEAQMNGTEPAPFIDAEGAVHS